jgi:hypothetical protein
MCQQAAADCLAISDNVVCPEILEVFSLFDVISPEGKGVGSKGRAQACSTLVKEENLCLAKNDRMNSKYLMALEILGAQAGFRTW